MRSRLFRKYAFLFAGVVAAALIANGLLDILFSYRDQLNSLVLLQRQQARFAADRIEQFVKDVEEHVAWTLNLRDYAMPREDRRIDALRLLRQAPAVTEVVLLDSAGREEIRVSRIAPDMIGSGLDRSDDSAFEGALGQKRYYSPVYFRDGSEPYMTLGIAGNREIAGIALAEINLRFVWDVLGQILVGQGGRVYVTDARGVLIAHPDISLVLSHVNASKIAHVSAALAGKLDYAGQKSTGLGGDQVIAAGARIPGPGWLVFVETPIAEAYAPVYASVLRSGVLLALAIGVALAAGFIVARRMTEPIAALSEATTKIGAGDLTQRVNVRTGDELETLSDNVNTMAERLRESYANLERKVEERTRQLAAANAARSRFLAIASHDLRQPLHALGLFVGQLRRPDRDADAAIEKAESALGAMNDLFDVLLDISKLDAGVVQAEISSFPVAGLFARLAATFEPQALEKGLSLRIVPSRLWVRSDPVLLERILTNLVSNAVRYTQSGSVIVGCRRRGSVLRIEVHDSGPGIPVSERENIFREFVRLNAKPAPDNRGLGLGLAVVERLSKVLTHDLEVNSVEGRGSCFSVTLPLAAPISPHLSAAFPVVGKFEGQSVVVIDDDRMVLEGMRGLLEGWGCRVCTVASWPSEPSISSLHEAPALIIADYSLGSGITGIEAIEALRSRWRAQVPALLISGDTTGDAELHAATSGLVLLRKPVAPMALRAVLIQVLTHA